MEKESKEILNRLKSINKLLKKHQFPGNNQSNKKLLAKTIIVLEKALNYIKNK